MYIYIGSRDCSDVHININIYLLNVKLDTFLLVCKGEIYVGGAKSSLTLD